MKLIICVVAALLVAGCFDETKPSSTPIQLDVEKNIDIPNKSNIIIAINKGESSKLIRLLDLIKFSDDSRLYYVFIRDLWNLEGDKHGVVHGDVLSEKSVKIKIANILLQAIKNRELNDNSQPYLEYLRGIRKIDGCTDYIKSILAIGVANDAQDLSLIKNEILAQDECSYRAASIALSYRCDVREADIIAITMKIQNKIMRDFLMETWEKSKIMRTRICGY